MPHGIKRLDRRPLVMARLWEVWKAKDGGESAMLYTVAITDPNAFMSEINDLCQ